MARTSRSSRMTATRRGLAAACGLLAVAATYLACGFTGTGTGPSLDQDALAQADAPISASDGGQVGDGSDFQTSCTVERTVCNGTCTDLSSDPANCSACGKACPMGKTCFDGGCDVLCVAPTVACGGDCVDPKTDPANCGKCGNACSGGTPYCLAGLCVPDCGDAGASTLCPASGTTAAYCADLATDRKNCGKCGTSCAANEVCTGAPAACKPLCTTGSLPGDVFGPTMVGCTGKIKYAVANTLCPAGTTVCSPAQYAARWGGKKPTYNYWTSANLAVEGRDKNCSVDVAGTFGYSSCNNPMRVCTGYSDGLGNQCNGINCGYQTRTNQYFGGCTNNTTAGALCCSP